MDAPTAARALAVSAEEFEGDRGRWAGYRASTYDLRGDSARARAWADTAILHLAPLAPRADANSNAMSDLAVAQVLAGRHTAATATLTRSVARFRVESGVARGALFDAVLHWSAGVAALAGARDSALAWLREARGGQPSLNTPASIRLHPSFASLRGDPRFEALLAPSPR